MKPTSCAKSKKGCLCPLAASVMKRAALRMRGPEAATCAYGRGQGFSLHPLASTLKVHENLGQIGLVDRWEWVKSNLIRRRPLDIRLSRLIILFWSGSFSGRLLRRLQSNNHSLSLKNTFPWTSGRVSLFF